VRNLKEIPTHVCHATCIEWVTPVFLPCQKLRATHCGLCVFYLHMQLLVKQSVIRMLLLVILQG